mgnify:FL=1|jgi:tetratricopeptide (TPR) repeat protein
MMAENLGVATKCKSNFVTTPKLFSTFLFFVVKMSKNIFFIFVLLSSVLLFSGDFNTIVAEAKQAVSAREYADAASKYDEAIKLADTSARKYTAYRGKYTALRKAGKIAEADKVVEIAVEDEDFRGRELRKFINDFAQDELWGARYEKALEMLIVAQEVPCSKGSNEYFQTCNLMAHLYSSRMQQPEVGIQIMQSLMQEKHLHPGNYYSGWLFIGNAQERLGNWSCALESYKTAHAYLKEVKYKVSFTEIETRIKNLEEKLKK